MAKKLLEITNFSGGLNSYSDARDIKDNEFARNWNAIVDKSGIIRASGMAEDYIDTDSHVNANFQNGFGLFQFSTEYSVLTDAGRRFNIISGSAGVAGADYSVVGGRNGWFYPDVGFMVFGEKLSNDLSTNPFDSTPVFGATTEEQAQLYPNTGSNEDGQNALRFVNCLRKVDDGNILTLNGEKETNSTIYACRIGPSDFNHTTNFSIISGSGRTMFTPGVGTNPDVGVMDGFPTSITSSAFLTEGESSNLIYGSGSLETLTTLENGEVFIFPGNLITTMHGDPHTFVTGIELFDEHGEMLATAKTSKPIKKAFDRALIIKVKLTF